MKLKIINKNKDFFFSYSAALSLCFLFFSFLITPVYAQEEPLTVEEPSVIEAEEQTDTDNSLTPAMQRTEMEIKTSTLSELAFWCRTLGLPENGTREELSQRLRQHFSLPQVSQEESGRRTIIIEHAQTTEYFTIDVINEDYARLKGNVSLSLQEGGSLHKIRADEILFNRTRNILTARGNVVYEKTGDGSIETFRGENITVNIDTWSSILLDGSSARELENDGNAYLFSGSVISHNDDDVTVINSAKITNASNEDALWSINASRLWLLPGNDFAVLNAVLKVGEIPVLYLPFFYFPGDTLLFHPVIGYRSREGGFVQTTTYLIGQPRSDNEETSSISRILGNTGNMETERNGLFLRRTGRRIYDPDSLSLKFIFDYYVNLGFYTGLDLLVPKTGILNPLELSIGLGFTRTIYEDGIYTPYSPNYGGMYDWNKSNLFSQEVPFRYRMNFQSSISAKYGSLNWSIPFYSDPYVSSDFLNRSEYMDWLNIIQEDSDIFSEIRSYQWHINGNINPVITALNPFITRLNVSNISTTLSFKTLKDDYISTHNKYSPGRLFYAPDKFTIYNITGAIAGSPLTLGGAQKSASSSLTGIKETDDPLGGIGTPVSPWQTDEENASGESIQDILSPPVISQRFSLPAAENTSFGISYQLTPASSTELQFMSGNWKTYKDVDWSEIQSVLSSFNGTGSLSFSLDHTNGLFSNVFTFSGNGVLRNYGFLNEEAYPAKGALDEARRQQYSQTNYASFYAYNGNIRPFYRSQIFSQTGIQYSFRGTLVRSKRYSGTNWPELEPQWGSWVKEERAAGQDILGLTIHRLTFNLAANILNYQQNISLSTELPPLDALISFNATFRFLFSETNVNFRIEGPNPSLKKDEWTVKPVYITETLKFNESISFIFNMIIKPEEDNDITNIAASLSLWNFKASFTALKTREHVFTIPGGWKQQGEPVLLPSELLFSYKNSFAQKQVIKNILYFSINVDSSLSFNLQKYTSSNFQLTLGINAVIPGLLELSLSATSTNSSVWRYFKGVPGMEDMTQMYPDGPQNNVLIDLLYSFNFFDEAMRRTSAFKIQKLEFKAVHFLGDWTAELGISMYPYQHELERQKFQIATDFHFIVTWRPISEIKSEIGFNGRNSSWAIK